MSKRQLGNDLNLPIPYGKQNIIQDDVEAVVEVLTSDFLTQGPKIQEFETAFAAYTGSKYAVAVANGTAALHLSSMVLNVNSETEVITTPITFAATANCVRYCGGSIQFVDIDPETYTISIDGVRDLLVNNPKRFSGIIPVDFTGYPVDLENLQKIAKEYNLWILEDACHAPGGFFVDSKGKSNLCGNGVYSDLSIFSFHPVKHIACGEGGMITTNNPDYYDRLLSLRTHGIIKNPNSFGSHERWYYELHELGFNYRLTDIQCALGISQLKRAEEGLKARQSIAKKYDNAFQKLGIVKQKRTDRIFHAYHLYVIEVMDRKGLFDYLHKKGIYCQVHYIPVHTLPYYQNLGFNKGDYPIAETFYERCMSLPIYPTLTDDQQDFIIESVISYLS